MKTHELKTTTVNHITITYFCIREKNDRNGNARFRVFIIDPETPRVYEKIFKCYESQLSEYVKMFVEAAAC
jgi:hypothetical protein